MRVSESSQPLASRKSSFDSLQKEATAKTNGGQAATVPSEQTASAKLASLGGDTDPGIELNDAICVKPGAVSEDGLTISLVPCNTPVDGGTPIPVEPDGGIGDGAGPIPGIPDDGAENPEVIGGGISNPGDMGFATTLAIGEEDGGGVGAPIPVEPDGGIGDGAGPIPIDPDGPIATTLAIGEEDGGGGGPTMDGDTIIGTRENDTLQGTNGDDLIRGRKGDDTITTGQGTDTVRGGKGDDIITVTGTGDKTINGGKGTDTLELKGTEADYAVQTRESGTRVYTAADGSRIVARNIESVEFTGITEVAPTEPPISPGLDVFYELAPNALGAQVLSVSGDTARLSGDNIDFTFTGYDRSGLAFDGPITASGGSGIINGVETTAVPVSQFGDAVLTISAGFNPTGTQSVSAAFANGETLNATVQAIALP